MGEYAIVIRHRLIQSRTSPNRKCTHVPKPNSLIPSNQLRITNAPVEGLRCSRGALFTGITTCIGNQPGKAVGRLESSVGEWPGSARRLCIRICARKCVRVGGSMDRRVRVPLILVPFGRGGWVGKGFESNGSREGMMRVRIQHTQKKAEAFTRARAPFPPHKIKLTLGTCS